MTINKKFPIYFFYVLFVLMIIVRDIYCLPISKYAYILVVAIYMLLGNKEDIFCCICFLIPIFSGIPLKNIIVVSLFCLFVKYDESIVLDKKCLVYSSLILILETISILNDYFSVVEYIRFIMIFGFLLIFVLDQRKQLNYAKMIKFYLLGTAITIFILILQMLKYYTVKEFLGLGLRFGNVNEVLGLDPEIMRIFLNPNELGIQCALSICFLLVLFRSLPLVVSVPGMFFYCVVGIMTQSRTFIITLPCIAFIYLYGANIKWKAKIYYAFILAIILLITAFFVRNILLNYFLVLVRRFTEYEDISNGRVSITLFYIFNSLSSVFRAVLGVGTQNVHLKYNCLFVPHNLFLEIFINWGIIGFVFVYLLFRRFFYLQKNSKEKSIYRYVPFIIYLIMLQTGQGFSLYYHILYLVPIFAAMRMDLGPEEILCD